MTILNRMKIESEVWTVRPAQGFPGILKEVVPANPVKRK